MAEAIKRASFATEDMKEGGGNFFGANGPQRGTVLSGHFTKEPPNEQYAATGNPIFGVVVFDIGKDAETGAATQYSQSYSLGALVGDNYAISQNGQYLEPNDPENPVQIVKDSKFGTFAQSLQREGVSKTILQNFSWDQLVGLTGDWKRVADKERSFSDERKAARGGKPVRQATTLVLAKLVSGPGKAAATTAKPAATNATAAAAVAAGANEDLDVITWGYLEQALKEKGGTMQRGHITMKLLNLAKDDATNRKDIGKRGAEESFLASLVEAGLVRYDAAGKGQPVTLATVAA